MAVPGNADARGFDIRNYYTSPVTRGLVGPCPCVGTLQAGIPLNLAQRWLGRARISTTAIYADVCGPEEQAIAARFWRANDNTLSRQEPVALHAQARRRP
jgi:hypothetical protein